MSRTNASKSQTAFRLVILLLLLGGILAPGLVAAVQSYLDTSEYELHLAIQSAQNPRRRLELLKAWRTRYPRSMFRQERFNLTVTAYQVLGDSAEMLATAQQMAADDPKGLGNYWLTLLTVQLQDTSPVALQRGRVAAEALQQHLADTFELAKKPGAVAAGDWYHERERQRLLAVRTLGWIAMQRHEWDNAERRFTEVLRANPRDAEASYWLGASILSSRQAGREATALYHVARSLSVTGKGALTLPAKAMAAAYLRSAFTNLHGSQNGVDRLIAQTRAGAFPPNESRMARRAMSRRRR